MSERDKQEYAALKANPEKYAAYLERKRKERAARPFYETARKRKWGLANPERADIIRKANHAVDFAITLGLISRAKFCSRCGDGGIIEAHHRSYEKAHWLIIEWLCQKQCHRKADQERIAQSSENETGE
jgi:ribosomal protein S27AE